MGVKPKHLKKKKTAIKYFEIIHGEFGLGQQEKRDPQKQIEEEAKSEPEQDDGQDNLD